MPLAFLRLFEENVQVATPDGAWHRDSHYWRKLVRGVHKAQILIREKLEDFLRNFFGEEFGVSGGLGPPKRKLTNEQNRYTLLGE